MSPNSKIKTGRYLHYKGKEYVVLGTAIHSETMEDLVVYQPQYGEMNLWVRPLDMFCENVEINGETLPRFKYVGE